jgi:voltage-gated potassium channel
MLVLSFVWLLLVLVELVWSTSGIFTLLGTVIWIVFVGEFLLRLVLAPDKLLFLQNNSITIVALIAPAFRFFRGLRFLRLTRGLRLMRIVGTANRSLNALRLSFGRRGLGYVLGATVLIVALGAGGMLAFEPRSEVNGGFTTYADALWWTAMIVTTMGSGFWPETAEGRLLTFLLTIYGYAVFS